MEFPFNERKAAQMAARMLSAAGGKLDVIVLIKLMYLADRRALTDRGFPITGASMASLPNGPVLSEVLDHINGEVHGSTEWPQFVSRRTGHSVWALEEAADNTDQLSRYELQAIDETFQEIVERFTRAGEIQKWKLRDWTHELPEWENPGGSSRAIVPETILRAEGRSDDEIAALADDAENYMFTSRWA
ncbi:MAG: Panacea domain-containing protein [Chloroflexi bacterium]|nr:Panacea domain-containing protein [Chloroflexota bacterium]